MMTTEQDCQVRHKSPKHKTLKFIKTISELIKIGLFLEQHTWNALMKQVSKFH